MKFTSIDLDESILYSWAQCIREVAALENVEPTELTTLSPGVRNEHRGGMARYEWTLSNVRTPLMEPGEPLADIDVWFCTRNSEKVVTKEVTLLGRAAGRIAQAWSLLQRDLIRMGHPQEVFGDGQPLKIPLVYKLSHITTMFEEEHQGRLIKPFDVEVAYEAFDNVARLHTAACVCIGLQRAFDEQKSKNLKPNPVHIAMCRQIARSMAELKPFEMLESSNEAMTMVEMVQLQLQTQADRYLTTLFREYIKEEFRQPEVNSRLSNLVIPPVTGRLQDIVPYFSVDDIPEQSALDELARAVDIMRQNNESDVAFRARVANSISPALQKAARASGISMQEAAEGLRMLGASFKSAKEQAAEIDEAMSKVIMGVNLPSSSGASLAALHAAQRAQIDSDQKAIAEEISKRLMESAPLHLRNIESKVTDGGELVIRAGRATGKGEAKAWQHAGALSPEQLRELDQLHETGTSRTPARPMLPGEPAAEAKPSWTETMRKLILGS